MWLFWGITVITKNAKQGLEKGVRKRYHFTLLVSDFFDMQDTFLVGINRPIVEL